MSRLACDVARGVTSGGATLLMGLAMTVHADTLSGVLVNAYQNNPQRNSQRAVMRQTDETVPQALSGYKSTVSATALLGEQCSSSLSDSGADVCVCRQWRHAPW
jgi:outer membrane protein